MPVQILTVFRSKEIKPSQRCSFSPFNRFLFSPKLVHARCWQPFLPLQIVKRSIKIHICTVNAQIFQPIPHNVQNYPSYCFLACICGNAQIWVILHDFFRTNNFYIARPSVDLHNAKKAGAQFAPLRWRQAKYIKMQTDNFTAKFFSQNLFQHRRAAACCCRER